MKPNQPTNQPSFKLNKKGTTCIKEIKEIEYSNWQNTSQLYITNSIFIYIHCFIFLAQYL